MLYTSVKDEILPLFVQKGLEGIIDQNIFSPGNDRAPPIKERHGRNGKGYGEFLLREAFELRLTDPDIRSVCHFRQT